MADTAGEALDHGIPQTPAGETWHNAASTPGLVLFTLATTAFLVCLGGFALRLVDVGIGATIVALLAGGAALAWLTEQGRRVRQDQRDSDNSRRG